MTRLVETAVKTSEIIRAWRMILKGERPYSLLRLRASTPLRCPGCYACDEAHLGGEFSTIVKGMGFVIELRQWNPERNDNPSHFGVPLGRVSIPAILVGHFYGGSVLAAQTIAVGSTTALHQILILPDLIGKNSHAI